MKTVGVIGLGSVGWAVIHGLSRFYHCVGYDIAGEYNWDAISDAEIIFICVATPITTDGELDCSNVSAVLKRLASVKYDGCVVIKSTVSIGFTENVKKQFPSLRLIYMPEFLREKSSFTWFAEPDRIVVSGEKDDIDEALSFFSWVKETKTLIMDYRSAEIGKLAHNAFIATKVSFTNEIENICHQFEVNPIDVMGVIWADRRVMSTDHLIPGLGPYEGKCVPKDTHELIRVADNPILLEAVEAVNKNVPPYPNKFPESKIIVIIPSNNRPEKLKRALKSVESQTRLPDKVIIVSEESDSSIKVIHDFLSDLGKKLNIDHITNIKTKNLSGAVNTALDYLSLLNIDLDNTYIAFLDDDDWWDRQYLQNNIKYALETNSDWTISGLIRHDESYPQGETQPIPDVIFAETFFITNPNIQGSNLFLRLSELVAIGGFDENLPSTTDRDVCIRLLDRGIKYAILRNHLVHHDAFLRVDRLSYPGSERKKQGLCNFYSKYSARMNSEQKEKFIERAKKLFAIEVLTDA